MGMGMGDAISLSRTHALLSSLHFKVRNAAAVGKTEATITATTTTTLATTGD